MIKQNEVRYGNWVQDDHEIIRTVYEIRKGYLCLTEKDYDPEAINSHITLDRIYPIPLTPEILESAGFKKEKNFYRDTDCYVKGTFFISGTWFHKRTGYKTASILNDNMIYVHQLQNVWFALHNEELEINIEQLYQNKKDD